jgi:hypothetical protein
MFKLIKDYVLRLKEHPAHSDLLVSHQSLKESIEQSSGLVNIPIEDVVTAVGHLANHGYVSILRGLDGRPYVLLFPDMLMSIASSLVLEARRNERGLGAIDERRALRTLYEFEEYGHISESDARVITNFAVYTFVKSNVCFRESFGVNELLVFPSLINQRKPTTDDIKVVEDVSYVIRGAIENIYSSLVVLLGYSNSFTRTHQWANKAQYVINDKEVCGFTQYSESEGEVEVVLYFQEAIKGTSKTLFQALFEAFLSAKDVSVLRFAPVVCTQCAYTQQRAEVTHRVNSGEQYMYCTNCGTRLPINDCATALDLNPGQRKLLEVNERSAIGKTSYESHLVRLKGFLYTRNGDGAKPSIFISYAWGNSSIERWIEKKFALDLRNAGMNVLLDRWFNAAISSSISRFVAAIGDVDFVICVGTSSYKDKYENRGEEYGTVVAAEMDLISQRLLGTEAQKKTVLPVLREGKAEHSFPPLLQGRVYANFTKDKSYFAGLFDLILSIYGIDFSDEAVIDLREEVRMIDMPN